MDPKNENHYINFPIKGRKSFYGKFWKKVDPESLRNWLLDPRLQDQVVDAYFGQKYPFYSSSLLEVFLKMVPEKTVDHIRTSKAFLKKLFWDSISDETFQEHKKWLEGFQGIRDLIPPTQELMEKDVSHKLESGMFTLSEIYILSQLYHEQILWEIHLGKEKSPPQRELGSIEGINRLLKKACKFHNAKKLEVGKLSLREVERLCKEIKDKPKIWKEFEELVLLEKAGFAFDLVMDHFSTYGDWLGQDETEIDLENIGLPQSEMVGNWIKTSSQERAMKNVIENVKNAILWRKGIAGEPIPNHLELSSLLDWEFKGFPKHLTVDGKRIHSKAILAILKGFSEMFSGSGLRFREKWYNHLAANPSNLPFPARFLDYINSIQADEEVYIPPFLCILPFQEFEDICKEKTKPNSVQEKIAQNSIEFICQPLYLEKGKKKWIALWDRPFIRIGDMVCWNSIAFQQNDHASSLQNLVFQSWENNEESGMIDKRSKEFEKRLKRNFEGIDKNNVWQGVEVNLKKGPLGDFDVIWRKGNEFLLIEAKSTYTRYTQKQNYEFRNKLEKAGNQLGKLKAWAISNHQPFLALLGIKEKIENPAFCTLIVSNSQEGNGERFGNGRHLKTSAFDLAQLCAGQKAKTKNYFTEVAKEEFGSSKMAEKVLEYAALNGDPVSGKGLWQYLKKRKEGLFIESLLSNTLPNQQEIPTPSWIIEGIENEWVWGEFDFEEFYKEQAEQFEPLPEVDLEKAIKLSKQAEIEGKKGHSKKAANLFLESIKLGNLEAVFVWGDLMNKLFS